MIKKTLILSLCLLCSISYAGENRPKVGLALSSGGARGLAHIGVLKALEQEGIPIDMIAGTSMGSIVGGLYACGYSAEQLERIVKGIDWLGIFTDQPDRRSLLVSRRYWDRRSIIDLRFDKEGFHAPSGLLYGQKIYQILFKLTAAANFAACGDFNRLKIPFRAVTVDIATGEPVVLSGGDLAQALRASMSIPFAFSPVKLGNRLLVDGGVLNNLPTNVVKDMGADIIIGVDVSSGLMEREKLDNLIDIAMQTMRIWTVKSNEPYLQIADVLIRPDLGDHLAVNYSEIDSLIEWGYKATMEKMEEIKRLVGPRRRNNNKSRSAKDDLNKATIVEIKTEGNKGVHSAVIRREFPLKIGDVFNLNRALQGINNIYSTGLFKNVWLEVKNLGNSNAKLVIHVEEVIHSAVELGVNYRNEIGESGFLQIEHSNLLGWGGRLRLILQGGKSKSLLHLGTQNHRILTTDFTLKGEIYLREERPLIYADGRRLGRAKIIALGGDISAGIQIKRLGLLTLGIKFKNAKIKNGLLPSEQIRSRSLVASTIVDDLDDPYFPTRGRSCVFHWESTLNILNSNIDYWKFSIRSSFYFTFKENHTLSPHFRLGLSRGELPFYEKYRLGGVNSLMGFHRDEFWGAQMLSLALSYRFAVMRTVYLRANLTLGGTWEEITTIEPGEIKFGLGGGIAVSTPIGPISLDWGWGKAGRRNLYFSMGYDF